MYIALQILCTLCNGETCQLLSDRFGEHLTQYGTTTLTNLSPDISTALTTRFNSDMKVCPISLVSGGSDNHKRQEERLILRLEMFDSSRLKNVQLPYFTFKGGFPFSTKCRARDCCIVKTQ